MGRRIRHSSARRINAPEQTAIYKTPQKLHLVCRRYPASRPPCSRCCVMTPSIIFAYQSSTAAHFHFSHLMINLARPMAQLYLRSWIAPPHYDMQTCADNSSCRYFASIKIAACSRGHPLQSRKTIQLVLPHHRHHGRKLAPFHSWILHLADLRYEASPFQAAALIGREASILSTCTIISRHHSLLSLSLHRALTPSKSHRSILCINRGINKKIGEFPQGMSETQDTTPLGKTPNEQCPLFSSQQRLRDPLPYTYSKDCS